MTAYRIVCTDQVPVTQPTTHAHIVAVGTGTDPDKADQQWKLADVLAAMSKGESFFTIGKQSGKRASVEAVPCPNCQRKIIRSARDAVTDNNLDSLRRCQWV
jgi:hypothetical protein